MRLLLDTNIWVSAFLSPDGHCGRLVRRLSADRDVEIVTSLPLIDEIVDVLGRPRLTRRYGFAAEEVKDYVAWIWSATQLVVPVAESYGCRDQDDDVVCGTAVAAGVQYLTTRDDDLKRDPKLMQALRALGIEILTVSDLESRLGPVAG
jgi:putative PIN family toxin of toxin-antitoxin system